jgi:hypothetical protein
VESLDVIPAQGLGCEQALPLETLQVVPEALHKQGSLSLNSAYRPDLFTPVASTEA